MRPIPVEGWRVGDGMGVLEIFGDGMGVLEILGEA